MAATPQPPPWAFVLWAAVGTLIGLGVVGILSIGLYALAAALVLAVLGIAVPESRSSAALAIVPGLGFLPLVVGMNNLSGPGERCTTSATTLSCSELLSPWPFLVPGIVLVVLGGWLVWRFGRTRATSH